MSIPPEAQEVIEEAGQNTQEFLTAFGTAYMSAFVKSKLDGMINDSVGNAFPGVPAFSVDALMGEDEEGGDDEDGGGDDGGDEKELDEKKDTEPLAAGVALVGYRTSMGPDQLEHRYYDIACVSIKPVDSVITKLTRTHRKLAAEATDLLKVPGGPKLKFPGKKRFGKKDKAYYDTRFKTMQEFYDVLSAAHPVSISDLFLKNFELRHDPKREELLEVFIEALTGVCEEKEIDLDSAMTLCEKIGIDTEESELLKVVALDAIAKPSQVKVRGIIEENISPHLPNRLKQRGLKMGDNLLNQAVSNIVEASWGAISDTFATVTGAIGEAIDSGSAPIQALLERALEPLGNVVREKLGGGDSEAPPLYTIDIHRYAWLHDAVGALENGKAAEALAALERRSGGFSNKAQWAGYLCYNFGDDILEEIPLLADIKEAHEELASALLETWAVVVEAGLKSMKPLMAFKDEMTDNYSDEAAFQAGLRDALRQGGQMLAKSYFALPRKLKSATRNLGAPTTKMVQKLGRGMIEAEADLLGQVGQNWRPSNKGEVTPTFVDSLVNALVSFGNKAAKRFVLVMRQGTQFTVVNIINEQTAEAVDEVAGMLDELVGALPDPIKENVQPGPLCKNMIAKLTFRAAHMGVMKMSLPTEAALYEASPVEPMEIKSAGPQAAGGGGDSDGEEGGDGEDGAENDGGDDDDAKEEDPDA